MQVCGFRGRPAFLMVFFSLVLTCSAWGAPAADPGLEMTATRVPRPVLLAGVDLASDLGGDFDNVADLGAAVDRARRFGDVPAMLAASMLLHRVEAVAGRSSRHVTAEMLLGEAESMASAQEDPGALRLLACALRALSPGRAVHASLLEQKAQILESERATTPPARPCTLILRNKTRHRIDVWVNGRYLATIGARETRQTVVPSGRTGLAGYARMDGMQWGPARPTLEKRFIWTFSP